ncbi:spatacsin [Periplaneta americana]|uniref:spatacsin n=1 Tax=Periplaneta americana TaxID=6978 RepID=UPI0037E9A9CC
MEQRTVNLVKISPELNIEDCVSVVISQKLCHLCLIRSDQYAHLYSITNKTETGPCLTLTWKSSCKVDSCRFSEDGKQLFVLLETKSFQIHNLHDSEVKLVAEEDTILLSSLLESTGIELTESTNIKSVLFSKTLLAVLVESKWLVSLWIQYPEPLSVKSIIEISSCIAVESSREYVYSLTTGGNVAAYSIDSGRQIGVVNLYSLLPFGQGSEVLEVFSDITVSTNGDLVAVCDVNGHVFIARIQEYFNTYDLQEENSRWNCGDSIISASSGTSHTSIRTISSLLRIRPLDSIGDSASIYMFELTEKDDAHSYKNTWDSYLGSLKQSKNKENFPGSEYKTQVSRSSRRAESLSSHLLCVSEPPTGFKVQGLHITAAGLAVWYTTRDSSSGGIYRLYDVTSGSCLAEQIVPSDTVVVAGGCLGIMDAFLSPNCLWLFLGNLSRDVLVNKLLHCVETESIAKLLRGGEWADLAVPLPALADGLRQHQMDVVRLALGLHSQAFKSSFVRNSADSDAVWETKIQNIISTTDKLFDTVYNSLLENKHKLAFTEHLIQLYLGHANDLLQSLHESSVTNSASHSLVPNMVEEKKRAVIKQIMYHVVELRSHLRKKTKDNFNGSSIYQPLGCLDDALKKEWSKWQGLEDQDVIRDAVSGNNIPLLQTFLTTCRGWSSGQMSQGIRKEVFVWLEQLLMEQEIEKSKQILMNLGCEPHDELRDFCLKSFDTSVRDSLAMYLTDRGLLTLDELEAWDMLKLIEEILQYRPIPNGSFPGFDLPSYKRDVPPCDLPEVSENSGRLSISTITRQSREWRLSVLVELYFNTFDERLEALIEPEAVWKYLLYNNRDDMLIRWINIYYNKFQGTLDIVDSSTETGTSSQVCTNDLLTADMNKDMKIQRLFSLWDVTQSMVDSIYVICSMTRTKEVVLDHLSRFGVFINSEKSNPCTILTRFCRTKSLDCVEKVLNQPSANVSFSTFEDLFIKFCIKHNLFNLVFPCFQNCDFSNDRIESLCPSSPNEQGEMNWFRLWLTLKELDGSLSDESVVFQAVKDTTTFLSKGNINNYLQEHPFVVLATSIFSKKTLKDVFESKDGAGFSMSSDCLQTTLKHLPLLEMALYSQQNDYRRQPDVTVYQLLQGCSPFDVSKLFGWQSMHILKGEEFPHFTSEKLCAKYGHNVTLSYMYYLKQGRPSFAVNMFIIDQLRSHRRISKKMKKQACNFAHGLALRNFTNRSITCACVSFIEMLGADSDSVKIHVAAANKILSYFNLSENGDSEKEQLHRDKVGLLMQGLVLAKEQTTKEILTLLEAALQNSHSFSDQCDHSVVKKLLHWGLAVKFARLHHMKLPELLLRQCAREDLWFPFVLFIQLHQYPVDQVLQLVKEFRSSHLQEHLSHALSNKMAVKQDHGVTQSRNKLIPRDSRKTLYTTIGFRKGDPGSESSSSSPTQATDSVMHVSSSSSEDSYQHQQSDDSSPDLKCFDNSEDVFSTLLKCHRSQDPPRSLLAACQALQNPLFAVFATCYEPSSVLPSFCTWLVTSLSDSISVQLKSELASALQQHIWSPQQVESLLEEAVSTGRVATLARGFHIFLPENPLCAFTQFLMECVVKKDFEGSIVNLKKFKAGCLNLKINPSVMESVDAESIFLNNGHWVSSVAVHTACIALAKCFPSSHHELKFIDILNENLFADHLPVEVPDFSLLAQLAKCLSGTEVHANWAALCRNKSSTEYQEELQHCVDQLVTVCSYQEALQFVSLVELPKDSVILAQWSHEFNKIDQMTCSQTDIDCASFWYKCHEAFSEAEVNRKNAVDFFKEHSEKVLLYKERYHILKLALNWMRKGDEFEESFSDKSSDSEEDAMEMEMWKCLLQVDTELEESLLQKLTDTDSKLLNKTKSELQKNSKISAIVPCTSLTEDKYKSRLDVLIGRLLDQGDIPTACRLEAMFCHRNQDLQLLWTCMSLAEGEITPYQLSAEHRLLLSEPGSVSSSTFKRRTLRSIRLTSSVSSSGISTPGSSQSPLNQSINSEYMEVNIRDKQDTQSVLEKLVEHLQYGKRLGNRILYCYRVAMNLDKSYQEVLKLEDPLELLKKSVTEDLCNKFIVASDIMQAAQMTSEEVATFLCSEISTAMIVHMQGEEKVICGVPLWGYDLDVNFHLFLELCDDPSKLGTKLLAEATHVGATSPHLCNLVVEMLIRAHDCYTAALNMEGIATVLRRVQMLHKTLEQSEQWSLMVRLLTGIERYTEMNYIFQTLKENDQFESLLGRRSDKVPNLKVAVVDFLKRYYPQDRETFHVTCIHFQMYSEVGDMWESDGHEAVRALLANKGNLPGMLVNTSTTKKCLETAMSNFGNAAQFFLQANKLTRSMAAAHQAELVALQISLVNAVPEDQGADILLELTSSKVANMITNKLSFPQACILIRAYSHPVDWGAALYEHCIVQGDRKYLTDFMYNITLTPALVEDVAKRFQLETNITQEMAQQMKKFVLGISDVEIKYRVASQLNFRDVIENLLSGPDVPYLKDTAWRSGFNRQHNYM